MGNSALHHLKHVDALRAVAILLVTVEHWLYNSTLNKVIPAGHFGVHLFFVISGFLITAIIWRTRYPEHPGAETGKGRLLRNFYFRRCLRIFPAYYLCVFIAYMLDAGTVREMIGWHLSYTTDILYFIHQGFIGLESHFWSLGIEEQFYLLWPFALVLTPRKWILYLIAGFIGLAIASRIFLNCIDHNFFMTFPISSFDHFGVGALIAWYYLWHRDRLVRILRLSNPLWWVSLMLFMFVLYLPLPFDRTFWGFHQGIDLVLSPVLFWVVARAAIGFHGPVARVMEHPLPVFLGKISYGMYLYHIFIAYYLGQYLPSFIMDKEWLSALCFLLATVALSSLSWYFYELPLNRLKRHFPYLKKAG